MNIAVAIVNWNSGRWLRACMESVFATLPDAEVVVVDNASNDGSLDQAVGLSGSVHFIRNATNRGLAPAMNQAFAATRSPYVLMLNPDVLATAGAVGKLEQVLRVNSDVAAVGGYVNDKYLPRNLPTAFTLMRQNLGVHSRKVRGPSTGAPRKVDQPAAAALLIRRSAFDQIGGFDEQFLPAWYEDVDFCHRLKSKGWKVYFAPEAEFVHEGGYSAKALGADAFVQAYYHNQLRYARKHFGAGASLLIRMSIAAGMIARTVADPSHAAAHGKVILGALWRW